MTYELNYKFDHVHVFSSDIAASEDWWVNKLGGELVRRRDPNPPAIDVRMGSVLIYIREKNPNETFGPGGPSRFGTDHIGLAVDDLDATAAELKRRGVEFQVEPYVFRPGLKIAFVKGPDQVRIELQQKG